jgi:hypothetical protein
MANSNFWVYSVEPMPRTDLFAKRDYNPTNDYIAFNSIYLDPIPAKTWVQIPDRFRSLRHHDRTDRQGHVYHVFADEIVKANQARLAPRGVVFTDHEPAADEKVTLEKEALEANMSFRLDQIQFYEESVKEAEANGRSLKANTYVKECYEVLGMERPGSVQALRAQRQPGEAVADRFAAAMEKLLAHLSSPKVESPGTESKGFTSKRV